MNLRRAILSLLCVWAMLVQSPAFASIAIATPHAPAAESHGMHCHGGHASATSHKAHHPCCGEKCHCDDLCASCFIALPALDDSLVAFAPASLALTAAVAAAPPAPPRAFLRPPISSPS